VLKKYWLYVSVYLVQRIKKQPGNDRQEVKGEKIKLRYKTQFFYVYQVPLKFQVTKPVKIELAGHVLISEESKYK
jgi:hypothetical protein